MGRRHLLLAAEKPASGTSKIMILHALNARLWLLQQLHYTRGRAFITK